MSKFVFIKEGDAKPNIFLDLMETVNCRIDHTDYSQQVGFYSRMDYSLRLGRNRTDQNPEMPLALFHFTVDPTQTTQNADTFRPVDVKKMMDILDAGADFVLFGFYSDSHLVTDYSLIQNAKYVVRDDKEVLIDYDTKQPILADPKASVAFITTLFGMVKIGPLPVYYLILDQDLVHISDGLDYQDTTNDVMYHLDNDATIKENFFSPTFDKGVTQIGPNILLTTVDSFTIDVFGDSLFEQYMGKTVTPATNITVDSDLTIAQKKNKITVTVTKPVGYVKYSVDAGKFFNTVQPAEKLEFEFVILKS